MTYILRSALSVAAAALLASQAVAWEVEKTSDPFTDQEAVTASHITPNGNGPFSTIAIVDCDLSNGQFSFALDVGIVINTNDRLFPFTFRVDKNTPQRVAMSRVRSNPNLGAFAGDVAIDLAKQMASGQKLVYRIEDEVLNTFEQGEVSLANSAGAIGEVLRSCGVADG
ncbi:MAG: hypothetical protein AAFQ84_09580 [Pseudomonadota bacterium]